MEIKSKKNINVVLVEPEIPNNTGNIGRTCVALEASLHLVGPMGFSLDEKKVRRAGLDYWPHLDLHLYDNQEEFFSKLKPTDQLALLTTKVDQLYYDCDFASDEYSNIWLIFGKETKGLSPEILEEYKEHLYTIPMIGKTRSLNLANSVAIVLYEAYRQMNHL
jgi:tRNA (cytidine/uridine-2'-O-)-methyltransferase